MEQPWRALVAWKPRLSRKALSGTTDRTLRTKVTVAQEAARRSDHRERGIRQRSGQ
ncbi:hypothetical protein BN2475_90028 [Paraburkholderia ribeironis]|uniref:Uncharacterized protein n=1 Tax=Paraburkholderia ribeironis TaxID=1247936 RepID=A0A1N7RMX8_9BURK|nr:hypothetical protein BN2475_90028 [Paraburkholderia ribeironis]